MIKVASTLFLQKEYIFMSMMSSFSLLKSLSPCYLFTFANTASTVALTSLIMPCCIFYMWYGLHFLPVLIIRKWLTSAPSKKIPKTWKTKQLPKLHFFNDTILIILSYIYPWNLWHHPMLAFSIYVTISCLSFWRCYLLSPVFLQQLLSYNFITA